jgi:hypothetical protein
MMGFEFAQDISAADIGRFLACPSDTPVVAWSLQRSGAIGCLEKNGILTGDPQYSLAKAKVGKKTAYEWMRQMMAERLHDYHQEWPIWCFLTRPIMPTENPDDKLLRMEIPKPRMLISFYEGWVKLLGVMNHLEQNGNQWPEQWLLYQEAPCLSPFEDKPLSYKDGMPVPRPFSFDERKCRSSWEQIFDLTLFGRAGFAWGASSPPYLLLQAMVPVIFQSDVKAILPFPTRE